MVPCSDVTQKLSEVKPPGDDQVHNIQLVPKVGSLVSLGNSVLLFSSEESVCDAHGKSHILYEQFPVDVVRHRLTSRLVSCLVKILANTRMESNGQSCAHGLV